MIKKCTSDFLLSKDNYMLCQLPVQFSVFIIFIWWMIKTIYILGTSHHDMVPLKRGDHWSMANSVQTDNSLSPCRVRAISRNWNTATTAASSCVTTSECFTGSVHFLALSKVCPRKAVICTSDNYEEAKNGSRIVSNYTLYDYGWHPSNTHKIKLWNILPFSFVFGSPCVFWHFTLLIFEHLFL